MDMEDLVSLACDRDQNAAPLSPKRFMVFRILSVARGLDIGDSCIDKYLGANNGSTAEMVRQ